MAYLQGECLFKRAVSVGRINVGSVRVLNNLSIGLDWARHEGHCEQALDRDRSMLVQTRGISLWIQRRAEWLL